MTKPFKDTKVGKFLIGEKGLFKSIGDTLPDKGFLGVLKNLISTDNTLSPFEKEKALELLKMDIFDSVSYLTWANLYFFPRKALDRIRRTALNSHIT